MADAPLQLADVQIGAALTDNWWRPTPYFQRYLQDNNSRITASIVGVQDALDQLAVQQATLAAQQAQIIANQAAFNKFQLSANGTAGSGSFATDASGFVDITHGYPNTSSYFPAQPQFCSVQPFSSTTFLHVQIIFVNTTTLRFRAWDSTNTPIVSGPANVAWHVAGA